MLIFVVILVVPFTNVLSSNIIYASVTYSNSSGKYTIHDKLVKNSVAFGSFQDEIFSSGWSYLNVETNSDYSDASQAYAAGLVEGFLTVSLLKNHWINMAEDYCNGDEAYCNRLKLFLQENMDFVNKNIEYRRQKESYWHQLALILEQLKGVEDGFKNVSKYPSTSVDVMGFFLLNLEGDLIDLEKMLGKKNIDRPFGFGSCSALIKILENNKDIYFSHVTWTGYKSMLRILKKYNFKFHTSFTKGSPVIPGHSHTFSSYPGVIFSQDDFYLLSSGLAAMETTLSNGNKTLWQYIKPNSVLEWQRNIIANRLAKDGKQWVNIFSKMNSGTYNNQWMILDYNKFEPGKPLQDGLLYVLEQLPNHIHAEEKTDILRKYRYWASYNVAYYQDIFDMSGGPENVEKYGNFFSHDNCPRALIFKRGVKNVTDIDSMTKLMRYNNFKNDPLSRCNCTPPYSADCAISARDDLNPINGTYPFESLGHSHDGGTDMKLTTHNLFQSMQFIAIGGPTYDDVPPFQWSKTDFGKTVKHVGHPDLWMFKPVVHKWEKFSILNESIQT